MLGMLDSTFVRRRFDQKPGVMRDRLYGNALQLRVRGMTGRDDAGGCPFGIKGGMRWTA